MSHLNSLRHFCVVLLTLGCFAFAPNALAKSSCKGMAKGKCVANQSCGWVDSYKRKDGRSVKAHCRTLPKKKATTTKSTTKAKATTNTKAKAKTGNKKPKQ